ncbi:glycosyltransferase family 4 protein [Bacillus sp. F19]|nr:glycosyltransferase family 4 protein [Bacillus sp. F19]
MKDNDPSKKILFVATVYTHLANFHKPYISMLQERGYEVHAACNPNEGRKQEIEELGVICWDIPFSRNPFNLNNFKATKELLKLFKTNYYELIHTHTPIASFLTRLLARLKNQGNILYTAHGFHFYKGAPFINWLLYYPIEFIANKWTDGLIVMNKEDYEAGKKMGRTSGKNIFLTNGVGVDLNTFNSESTDEGLIRRELNIPPNHLIVSCVAELTVNKNHLFLLKAWEILSGKYDDIQLLIVGSGENEYNLKKYVHETKLNNIHFLGFRKDIPSVLQDSDIVTLLSKREGLPKCIMEAMAASKPVIVSNTRGLRDLVTHNKNGLVVDLDNYQQLINSFEVLIQSEEMRRLMGKNGFEKIRKYSIENVVFQLRSIYNKYLIK